MCLHMALEVSGGKQGILQVRDNNRFIHTAGLASARVVWMACMERLLMKKQPCDGLPSIICRCFWCKSSVRSQAPRATEVQVRLPCRCSCARCARGSRPGIHAWRGRC